MAHNLPEPVMGSTGGSSSWGERRFNQLCRNYDERTGKLKKHPCEWYTAKKGLTGPCPFVHPNDPRWLQLGGRLPDPPAQPSSVPISSAPSGLRQTSSITSTSKPPQQPERPRPPPPIVTQVSNLPGPSTISPLSRVPGTADPRRRPSISTGTAGPDPNMDLTKLQAQLQDPDFMATLKNVVEGNSQPPTPTAFAPPAASPVSRTHPQPQVSSQPPPPAPLKSDPWAYSTAAANHWDQRSPPQRENQAWQSSASNSSSAHWGRNFGPNADSSWTGASSSNAPPLDSWGSGDWSAMVNTAWDTRPTTAPTQAGSTPVAPPPEKPASESKPAPAVSREPQPSSASSNARPTINAQPAVSNAPSTAKQVPQETPVHSEPSYKPGGPSSTTTNPKKPTIEFPTVPPPKPASVDEQPPSPDKLYEYSKHDDDPELSAWRAIIKELGSIYRDHVRHQELSEQQSELAALVERAAARGKPQPATNVGQADTGPYSGRIKDIKEQMGSLTLNQEAKASEWAAATTQSRSTAAGSGHSAEAALLMRRRSKSLWPFEPPEGKYIPKGQVEAEEAADLDALRHQIDKMVETLNEARSELDRVQEELVQEMETLASKSDPARQAAEPPTSSDETQTPDELVDIDLSEELPHLTREVDRLSRDVDFIVGERHSMWEDAHAALGLELPGEEEGETRSPASDNPRPPQKVDEQEVDPDVDGDEMNLDAQTESAILDELEDDTKALSNHQRSETPSTSALQLMKSTLSNAEQLLEDAAQQAYPLATAIENLVMEEMCQADIAFLAAANEELKGKMLVLEEKERAEDVYLQQLYATVMALDTTVQPNVDQLIDGIVQPVVDEVRVYMQREFGGRASTRDQAWQALENQLKTLMEPTRLVLQAILDNAGSLSPQHGNSNGVAWH